MTTHDIGLAYMDYAFIRGLRRIVDSIPVKMAIDWSDLVIVQNSVTYNYILRFKPKRIVLIPQGVDTDKFKPKGIRGRYVTFIAARLVKLKGDEVFVKAVPFVLKEIRDAEFRVIGRGHRKKYLMELARKTGALDKIDFTGPIPYNEIPNYLTEANIVVCPGAPAGPCPLGSSSDEKANNHGSAYVEY